MKKSLSDFANTHIPQNENSTQKTYSQNAQNTKDLEKLVNQFQGMSKDELMQNFHAEVAKQKANGTFDIQKLENSLDSLDAFLSPQQKQNIKELLRGL